MIFRLPTAPNDTLAPLSATLPVIFAVPLMLAPVPVIVITLAVPTALSVILPFAVAIFTLLLPLLILDMPPPADCATQLRLPAPSVCNTYAFVPPVIFRLPTAPNDTLAPLSATFPETVKLTNVPVLVIFGCALVYTVPDINALAT